MHSATACAAGGSRVSGGSFILPASRPRVGSLFAFASTGYYLYEMHKFRGRKFQTALALTGASTLGLTLAWQHEVITRLGKENATLAEKAVLAGALRSAHERLSRSGIDSEELTRLRPDHDELLRLRGQYALLLRGDDGSLRDGMNHAPRAKTVPEAMPRAKP